MPAEPKPEKVASGPNEGYFVGVEVGASLIRAGVYSESLRLIGKTKLSTKAERGSEAVVGRIARCVLYAADECDLPMSRVRGVGVGIPGMVNSQTGSTDCCSELAWTSVPLRDPLEKLLDRPVVIENSYNLAALGVCSQELDSTPHSCLVISLGPQIGGAVIANGQFLELTAFDLPGTEVEHVRQNILGILPHPIFRHFRSRDFRKVLRKGNTEVRHYLLQVAHRGGELGAQLVARYSPEVLVFGGGVLDEMRDEMTRTATEAARLKLGCELSDRTVVVISALGDLAGISGAAAWAARKTSATAPASSVALDTVH